MSIDNKSVFKILVNLADKSHDGHLTILKFTTNWRVGFGTPDVIVGYPEGHKKLIQDFFEGQTFGEAALKAIEKEICQ